jgi:hypothetical protein
MIVYANEFYLKAKDGDLSILKQAIKTWMGKKIGPAFKNMRIIPFAEPFRVRREDTGPNEVMIIGTPDHADDYSLSINYRHNDAMTQGRAWFTRIGIERQGRGNPLHVTVLLETSEVSPQAAATPVTPSQPGVVHEILRQCPLDDATPGVRIRNLTPAVAKDFKEDVADSHRFHAIVVVSPDDFSEQPYIVAEELRRRLVGLAQIYEIPNKRDAWALRDGLLPSYHTAWDGSITVISPGREGRTAFGKVYRIGDIEAIETDTGLGFDRYLFNELTHRFNLAKSRRHVSDALVGRRLVAFKLSELRKNLGNVDGLQELVESYEEDRDKAKQHADELEQKLLDVEIHKEEQQTKIADLEKQVRSLQFHLRQASAGQGVVSLDHSETQTLPESLGAVPEWIEGKIPDRLIFTGRAQRTLKDSPFGDLTKVAAVFRILASRFHAAFLKEIQFGDATDALAEIPARYAGKQSEVTAGKKDGYDCTHNGVKYALQKHIGIGTSRDPRYCFRLYFEWEPAEQKILVLHAGVHLDTQST